MLTEMQGERTKAKTKKSQAEKKRVGSAELRIPFNRTPFNRNPLRRVCSRKPYSFSECLTLSMAIKASYGRSLFKPTAGLFYAYCRSLVGLFYSFSDFLTLSMAMKASCSTFSEVRALLHSLPKSLQDSTFENLCLRHIDVAHGLHALLARRLLFQQLLLARNVAAVALCQHVLAQCCGVRMRQCQKSPGIPEKET